MTTLPQTMPMRLPRPSGSMPVVVPVGGHLAPGSPAHGQSGMNLTGADVLRVLRANLWLILFSLVVFSVGGYYTNKYLAAHYARYKASGLIEVYGLDELPYPDKPAASANPAEIELVQQTQSQQFLHESNFLDDIQNDDSPIRKTKWFVGFNGRLDEAKYDLFRNLEAIPHPSSRLIQVAMTCADPSDAQAIVKELGDHHIATIRRVQTDIDSQKVKLLSEEQSMLEQELNEDVLKPMTELELKLGSDQMNTFLNWNGKQQQMSRLIEEEMRVLGEVAGYKIRLEELEKQLADGRTPAEVERDIRNTGTYTSFRFRVIELDQTIRELETRNVGESSTQMIVAKQTRAFWQSQADEEHEELKSTECEGLKAQLETEISASQANAARIQDMISKTGTELGRLNESMNDLRVFQKREQMLRDKLDHVRTSLAELGRYSLKSPWAAAKWSNQPQTPDFPSFPRLPFTMAAAIAAGLALSLGIAFLREVTDNTVRTDRDIAKVGQLNLLGMIQRHAEDPQSAGARLPLVIFDAPQSVIAEQFRQARTKLQHAAALDTTRSLMITSPSPGDGKSIVATNLAAALALNNRRILLVDANFRRPSLHATFGVENFNGFSDILNDVALFDSAVLETEVPNLSIIVSGERPESPTELLESQAFTDFLERALEEYDHVIFDSGPLLVVSDTVAMAPRVDGVITVVKASGNSRGLLQRMRDELRKVKAEHLGVVLNAVRSQGGGYYGSSIKTYYAYHNR